jgi:peptidoglycan hydrolase CwlO-like protein
MFDRRSLTIVSGATIVAASLLGACGSSAKSSSGSTSTTIATTTTAPSAVCQSANTFRSSLSAMTNPSTYTGGKASAQTALNNLKDSLNNVKSTLSSGDKPKVDALQSSIDDLQTAINNMQGLSGISNVIDAGKNVATSAQGVLDAVKAGCPS